MDEIDNYSEYSSKLPLHIISALKRKSSRDPNSRFSKKLHLLLSYVEENPTLAEEIGLEWTSETQFRLNKKLTCQIMGIKLNTLNVNLKDLGFKQLQHDKNGWTRWERDGFCKSLPLQETTTESHSHVKPHYNKPIPHIQIGNCSQSVIEQFYETVSHIWASLFNCPINEHISINKFYDATAIAFKQPEQPYENAFEVIQAIILPYDRNYMNFYDLYRFLAMFGPKNTIMLKISILLSYSNSTGNWLHFVQEPSDPLIPFYGSFDESEPNCLVIRYRTGQILRAWNLPFIEASGGSYIIDEKQNKYNNWENYFKDRIHL